MIADLLATYIGSVEPVASKVNAVRPLTAGLSDDLPYIIYESSGLQQLTTLNSNSPWYEGKVRLHVYTRDTGDTSGWAELNNICEAIKLNIAGQSTADSDYAITRIKFDDESDIDQGAVDNDTPFYVRSIDLWVRAKRL